jgi:tetratricopeptide (TPR) repeat protein
MQDHGGVIDSIGGSARLAREQVNAVKQAIDGGNLISAALELHEAEALLGTPETLAGQRVALDLRLEGATMLQYGGDFAQARELAEVGVEFASRHFGLGGIEVSRARLRWNFALEAERRFQSALRKNLELDDELAPIPGSQSLRLNCLTRAIACAVKNADRASVREIGFRSERLREGLKEDQHPGVMTWHFFWVAVASLRQGRFDDAKALLDHAADIGPRTWRWLNAASFVEGYGLTLERRSRACGLELLSTARRDAEKRGFYGHVRSIDAGFSGLGI